MPKVYSRAPPGAAGFIQGRVRTCLIGAERIAALQHQHRMEVLAPTRDRARTPLGACGHQLGLWLCNAVRRSRKHALENVARASGWRRRTCGHFGAVGEDRAGGPDEQRAKLVPEIAA